MNDYIYYMRSHKQALDYKKSIEFMINHIKGEVAYGSNIAESIQNVKYANTFAWYQRLKVNTETDPDKKVEGFRISNEI